MSGSAQKNSNVRLRGVSLRSRGAAAPPTSDGPQNIAERGLQYCVHNDRYMLVSCARLVAMVLQMFWRMTTFSPFVFQLQGQERTFDSF